MQSRLRAASAYSAYLAWLAIPARGGYFLFEVTGLLVGQVVTMSVCCVAVQIQM